MFWRNGYEPLNALDNDGNGWLEGSELKGIAVWWDRNTNGVSERGEVKSLAELGIQRIAVCAAGRQHGMLYNPRGIQMRDGSYRPTWDWVSKCRYSYLQNGSVAGTPSVGSPYCVGGTGHGSVPLAKRGNLKEGGGASKQC